MCGIAGIISNAPIDPRSARSMIEQLRHRGPDHIAVENLAGASIASARLSIVDIDPEANQPLWDIERRFVIAFNGEIYNFHEVAADLQGEGSHLATRSDTEVVIEAYKRWGEQCLHRFNGMFAFAIWDARERTLFLARDRFGVKPLFVRHEPDRFLFASEMKAILAAGVRADINADAVAAVLSSSGADRGQLSMFRGIDSLPPGHCAVVRPGERPRVTRWWRTTDYLVDVPKKREDRVELFRQTLLDAVRLRLRTDVDSAITLSAGLDSSSVYGAYHALLRTGRAERATTSGSTTLTPFVVAWPGDSIDEAPAARALAARFGDKPIVIAPEPHGFPELTRSVVWHQETIPWNAAILAYHLLYREIASRGGRVVLEGHGSDEMLGGYPQFASIAMTGALRQLRLGRAWSCARALASAQNVAADRIDARPMAHLLRSLRRRPDAPSPRVFNDELYGRPAPHEEETAPRGASTLRRALYRAFDSQVLPTILRIFDRASMAASVESRAPFLDYRLVTLVFSLPDDDILRHGRTKWIQREAARAWLPEAVVERPGKNGFAMPHPRWFRSLATTNALREALADGTIDRAAGVDRRRFSALLDEEVHRGFTYAGATALWQAYAYAQLCDVFRSA